MQFSTTVVGIITACASLTTAIALVIGSLAAWQKTKQVEGKVDQVHTIVNQQRTDMQRYIRALKGVLNAHGIELPVDQSIDSDE